MGMKEAAANDDGEAMLEPAEDGALLQTLYALFETSHADEFGSKDNK